MRVSALPVRQVETDDRSQRTDDRGQRSDNINTVGIRLWELPIGRRLKLGRDALAEVTQIGRECHSRCAIYHQVGDCVMPREGIFIRILTGGNIIPGDTIESVEQRELAELLNN